MDIDDMKVFEDEETTLATLPDPVSLDDEDLDMWQLGTLGMKVCDEIYENDQAADSYEAWEAAINAEWSRRFPDGKSPRRT